jgi:hypothetical protein
MLKLTGCWFPLTISGDERKFFPVDHSAELRAKFR